MTDLSAPGAEPKLQARAFTVRRAWLPFSVERSQSQTPVVPVSTDTAAPAMSVKDADR